MIIKYLDNTPVIHDSCFIAETATIIGKVNLQSDVNVWFGAVLRGDGEKISIGENTNIQENCVVHVDKGLPTNIGTNCTIGHSAIVHGSTIGDNVLVGMGAIVLDGAQIGNNVIIGAGALVPPNKIIPSNSLVVGSPCKIKRELTDDEISAIKNSASHYVELSKDYK